MTLIRRHRRCAAVPLLSKPQGTVASRDNKFALLDSESLFLKSPPEIRNLVYGLCFPSLPSSPTPLDQAHKYRPATSLILANKQVWDEASGFVKPIAEAWKSMTWTVDLDALADKLAAGHKVALPQLSQQDAEMVQTIRFTTSSFPVPLPELDDDATPFERAEAARSVFRAPFEFTLTRLSGSNDLVITSPHLSYEGHRLQRLDAAYIDLLFGLQTLGKLGVDKPAHGPPTRLHGWETLVSFAAWHNRMLRIDSVEYLRLITWDQAKMECERLKMWDPVKLGEQGSTDRTSVLAIAAASLS